MGLEKGLSSLTLTLKMDGFASFTREKEPSNLLVAQLKTLVLKDIVMPLIWHSMIVLLAVNIWLLNGF